jgi:hypothetical protein
MIRYLPIFAIVVLCPFSSAVLADAYQDCRKSQTEAQVIECIEKGIWNPCDEGAGPTSWVGSQCGFAHTEIASRKLKAIEAEISKRLQDAGKIEVRRRFLESQKMWRTFADHYCSFVNAADDTELFAHGDPYFLRGNFCMGRLVTERLKELSSYIQE